MVPRHTALNIANGLEGVVVMDHQPYDSPSTCNGKKGIKQLAALSFEITLMLVSEVYCKTGGGCTEHLPTLTVLHSVRNHNEVCMVVEAKAVRTVIVSLPIIMTTHLRTIGSFPLPHSEVAMFGVGPLFRRFRRYKSFDDVLMSWWSG